MSNDWFFEKFALISDAPGAVERMRELVLQLAVTGRLVPQEPTDEPASELTEKALSFVDNGVSSAQRARDIGKWKTVVDSGLSELPLGWTWTCNAVIGNTSPRVSVSDDALVAFVPMNVIPKDYRESLNPEIRLWTEIKRGYTHFADGDIVVAKITPCFQNGKACVMKDLPGGVGAGTTELHVLRPFPNTVIPLYMLLIFKSPEFVNGGVASFTGTAGQQRVSTDYFRYCPIPLPPLAEQKRIVAKVDELMGLCDALEAQQQERELRKSVLVRSSLSRFAEAPTPENLGYLFHRSYDIPPSELRKSILTLAVQGKLVPQDSNDRPATISKDSHVNKPFSIPEKWAWIHLEELQPEFQNGVSSRGDKGGIPIIVIRLADVDKRRIDLENPRAISISKDQMAKYRLEVGDTLITRVNGSADIVGTFIPVLESLDAIYCDHFIRMRIDPDRLFPGYTALVGDSQIVREQIRNLFITTAGQKTVNQGHIRSLSIPLPPLAEQHRIVAKVDQLMALVDELERQQEAARENASKLLDAIVQEMTIGERDIAATLES
jgi:type I restriction enzyme S subunit